MNETVVIEGDIPSNNTDNISIKCERRAGARAVHDFYRAGISDALVSRKFLSRSNSKLVMPVAQKL